MSPLINCNLIFNDNEQITMVLIYQTPDEDEKMFRYSKKIMLFIYGIKNWNEEK